MSLAPWPKSLQPDARLAIKTKPVSERRSTRFSVEVLRRPRLAFSGRVVVLR